MESKVKQGTCSFVLLTNRRANGNDLFTDWAVE